MTLANTLALALLLTLAACGGSDVAATASRATAPQANSAASRADTIAAQLLTKKYGLNLPPGTLSDTGHRQRAAQLTLEQEKHLLGALRTTGPVVERANNDLAGLRRWWDDAIPELSRSTADHETARLIACILRDGAKPRIVTEAPPKPVDKPFNIETYHPFREENRPRRPTERIITLSPQKADEYATELHALWKSMVTAKQAGAMDEWPRSIRLDSTSIENRLVVGGATWGDIFDLEKAIVDLPLLIATIDMQRARVKRFQELVILLGYGPQQPTMSEWDTEPPPPPHVGDWDVPKQRDSEENHNDLPLHLVRLELEVLRNLVRQLEAGVPWVGGKGLDDLPSIRRSILHYELMEKRQTQKR